MSNVRVPVQGGQAIQEYQELGDGSHGQVVYSYASQFPPGATPFGVYKRYTGVADEALVTPAEGNHLVVTNCRISTRATTAGQITVYFDADGDDDFDSGEVLVADDNFVPSATSTPGSKSGPIYVIGGGDKPLRVLTSAGINFTLMIEGFEIGL